MHILKYMLSLVIYLLARSVCCNAFTQLSSWFAFRWMFYRYVLKVTISRGYAGSIVEYHDFVVCDRWPSYLSLPFYLLNSIKSKSFLLTIGGGGIVWFLFLSHFILIAINYEWILLSLRSKLSLCDKNDWVLALSNI